MMMMMMMMLMIMTRTVMVTRECIRPLQTYFYANESTELVEKGIKFSEGWNYDVVYTKQSIYSGQSQRT